MKKRSWLYFFIIITITLSGCDVAELKVLTPDVEQVSTLMISSPSISQTPIPTQSKTPTLSNTLGPDKANEAIRLLLQEPENCTSVCFWGIIPGETSIGEAGKIFNNLGLQMDSTIFEGKKYSAVRYNFDSGLSIYIILTIQNDLVENIHVKINPEKQKEGFMREWMAYSPESLIQRYGNPSDVDFVAEWGPGPFFSMQMYYDDADLIIQYAGSEIIPRQRGVSDVCLKTVQFDSVWLWIGKNPVYPPGKGESLEEVASMNVEEFSRLVIEDSGACLSINGYMFP